MIIDTIVCEKKNGLTRLALMSGGDLIELEYLNDNQAAEGNIYLGKITHKVDLAHGKTGFFVDISDGREAFLNAEELGMNDANFTEGQSLIVQVAQEKRAEKGARLVRAIQFVGEHLVYCPYRLNVSASPRIEDKAKLEEYREKVIENTTGQEGWILRTSSVEVPFEVLAKEMLELRDLYEQVRIKARTAKAPALLYSKADPLFENIRRYASSLHSIVVNNHNLEKAVAEQFGDEFAIEYIDEPFEEMGLEEAIGEALMKTVKLPSGGRISIEETRACVSIDVYSGDDRGNGIVNRLNNEAAVEIAKQIRLRNLSGKIIIDFAGSSEYRYLKPVMEILENEMASDANRGRILGLSKAGNVEILRARRRPTLQDVLTTECECCQGTGRVEK